MTETAKLPLQDFGIMAQIACLWEASAQKPGNVHRYADFADLTYLDLLASAAAIGPVLEKAWYRPVGEIVLEAIKATRRVTTTNSNLGIVLLLTPLAAVPPGRRLRDEVPRILAELTVADAVLVYEAIRVAEPGGMGRVTAQDLTEIPTVTLRAAMVLAADRDRIARQYVYDFADIFAIGLPTLKLILAAGHPLETAVIATHLTFLAAFPDTLIERKFGSVAAQEVLERARHLVDRELLENRRPLTDFDAWLRTHRYNPGTSADLVAATLYAAMREGMITLPYSGKW